MLRLGHAHITHAGIGDEPNTSRSAAKEGLAAVSNQKHPRERRVIRADLSISVGLVGPVAKSFDETFHIAVTIDWCFGYMVVRFAHDMNVQIPLSRLSIR